MTGSSAAAVDTVYLPWGHSTRERTGWKAKALASSLLEEAGVAIIGGPDFGILGEGYVRLSYANSTENILKALARMGEFLATRKAA